MKNTRRLKLIIIPILCIAIILLRNQIIYMTRYFPECLFYNKTGYLCTSCGNTRSVVYLLKGHIIKSLRYNIAPVTLLIILILSYVQYVMEYFEKNIQIFRKNTKFLWSILGILIAYYVLRNFIPGLTLC